MANYPWTNHPSAAAIFFSMGCLLNGSPDLPWYFPSGSYSINPSPGRESRYLGVTMLSVKFGFSASCFRRCTQQGGHWAESLQVYIFVDSGCL